MGLSLAHDLHKHIATAGHGLRLNHQLRRLGDGYEKQWGSDPKA